MLQHEYLKTMAVEKKHPLLMHLVTPDGWASVASNPLPEVMFEHLKGFLSQSFSTLV